MNIDELNLMDAPLFAISINLNDAEIAVVYKKNGEIKHLRFIAVRKLNIDLPETTDLNSGSIFDVISEEICTGNTRIKFFFNFDTQGGHLAFEYANVKTH